MHKISQLPCSICQDLLCCMLWRYDLVHILTSFTLLCNLLRKYEEATAFSSRCSLYLLFYLAISHSLLAIMVTYANNVNMSSFTVCG